MAQDGLAQGRESRMPHIHLPIQIAVTTIPKLTTTLCKMALKQVFFRLSVVAPETPRNLFKTAQEP